MAIFPDHPLIWLACFAGFLGLLALWIRFLIRKTREAEQQTSAPQGKDAPRMAGNFNFNGGSNVHIRSVRGGKASISLNGMSIEMEGGRLFVNGQEWGPIGGSGQGAVGSPSTPAPTLVLDADGTLKGSFDGAIHVYGSQPVTLRIEGDVRGPIVSAFDVYCGAVQGDVDAGNSVTCTNVTGGVDAGGSVNCGAVGGDVDAGGSASCTTVGGDVDAGGSVACGDVGGDVDAGGNVNCGHIRGDVDAGGSVYRK